MRRLPQFFFLCGTPEGDAIHAPETGPGRVIPQRPHGRYTLSVAPMEANRPKHTIWATTADNLQYRK